MGPKFSCNRDFCQLLQKDFANMKENNSYIINTPPDPRYPFAFKVNHLWKEGKKKEIKEMQKVSCNNKLNPCMKVLLSGLFTAATTFFPWPE